MKLPNRLRYFFSPPPLWIIQIGRDKLIFSHIKNNVINEQEQLYLESNTLLLNKVANPSSLCHGIRLFCQQKKLSSIRAQFLLPKEFYPQPLLAHELFQFLVAIKNTPCITEAVMTNPFDTPTQLSTNTLQTLSTGDNYLDMFNRYNKIHPGWIFCGIILTSISAWCLTSWITRSPFTTKKPFPALTIRQPRTIHTNIQHPKKTSWPTIDDSLAMLLGIAHTIPPTIVLENISTKQSNTRSKTPPITSLTGITHNLHDLLEFVTNLEQKTKHCCSLSYIKEHSLPKSVIQQEDNPIILYRFSLTIDL